MGRNSDRIEAIPTNWSCSGKILVITKPDIEKSTCRIKGVVQSHCQTEVLKMTNLFALLTWGKKVLVPLPNILLLFYALTGAWSFLLKLSYVVFVALLPVRELHLRALILTFICWGSLNSTARMEQWKLEAQILLFSLFFRLSESITTTIRQQC